MRASFNSRLLIVGAALAWVIAAMLASAADSTAELKGKVVGVHDGDTITVLVGKKQVKVRLAAIDAPESGQDYGKKAKQALSAKVFDKVVRVQTGGTDRYGRTLGTVWRGDGKPERSVNHEMVAEGWAWHYKRYSKSEELADAEAA